MSGSGYPTSPPWKRQPEVAGTMSELSRFRRFFDLLGYELELLQELIAAEVFGSPRVPLQQVRPVHGRLSRRLRAV
jgi:hypothetical protein